MPTANLEAPRNSTTDRTVPLTLRAIRLWFAVESRIAPGSAENRAARMFATPPSHKRSTRTNPETIGSDWVNIAIRDGSSTVAASALGHGPTVMLIHGWGGSAKDMTALAIAFAKAGYRSIVFDMPGHGRSSGRESSLVEFLGAMRAVVRIFGTPDFLVGHSFGGSAAILGITELALPVRGAVLVSPAPGPAYYVDRFARTLGLPTARTHGMVKRLVERVGRTLESLDAVSAAQHARVPALVFHDPADREVPFEFSRQMTDAWEGARLIEAPSLGHKRILRDPATIATAVDFVRSLSP